MTSGLFAKDEDPQMAQMTRIGKIITGTTVRERMFPWHPFPIGAFPGTVASKAHGRLGRRPLQASHLRHLCHLRILCYPSATE